MLHTPFTKAPACPQQSKSFFSGVFTSVSINKMKKGAKKEEKCIFKCVCMFLLFFPFLEEKDVKTPEKIILMSE